MAHIMVVDDESDVLTLVKFLLEKEGHTVSEAINGVQALEKLGVDPLRTETELPDIIILDVMMPLMDGYTVSTRLRQDERTRSIPLIILTARGQMRDIFTPIPNVAGYIDKPFDSKKLRELITSTLSQKT